MPIRNGALSRFFFLLALLALPLLASAQTGNAGAVHGTVTDPSGAVIPGATVHLTNAVSGLDRTATTDPTGNFDIPNVPFNNYQVTVSAGGFAATRQNTDVHSVVGTTLKLVLQIAAASQTVTVQGNAASDLV